MQGEVSTLNPWVPVVLTIVGLVVGVAIPLVGWAFRSVHRRIDEVKTDALTQIETVRHDAEAKRLETRDTILELVESKFDAVKDILKDIKDELKSHFRTT